MSEKDFAEWLRELERRIAHLEAVAEGADVHNISGDVSISGKLDVGGDESVDGGLSAATIVANADATVHGNLRVNGHGVVDSYFSTENPAFYVALSSHWTTLNTIIKFDEVFVNRGNGYDPSTGLFTVPVDGVYLLCQGGIKYNGDTGKIARLSLQLNGDFMFGYSEYTQARISEGATYGYATHCTIVPLSAGDEVGVYVVGYGVYAAYTYFTGAKIA